MALWRLRKGFSGGSPDGYNPSTVLGSDLLCWWDANPAYWGSNGNIVGSPISSWTDVTAGFNMTAAGAAQPTASTGTAFGSFVVPVFDGANNNMTCNDAGFLTKLGSGAATWDVWSVFSQDEGAVSNLRYAFAYGGNGGANQADFGKTNNINNFSRATISSTVITGTTHLTTRHLYRAAMTPTTTSIEIDGVADTSLGAVPNLVATRGRIGSSTANTAAQMWLGSILCVLVTNPLTGDARESGLRNWLLGRRMV